MENDKKEYEYVNHPTHYNKYSLEVIYILEKVYGIKAAAQWCEMTAMKYRLRMGTKPNEPIERDIEKESWYLKKRDELLEKYEREKAKNVVEIAEDQFANYDLIYELDGKLQQYSFGALSEDKAKEEMEKFSKERNCTKMELHKVLVCVK